MLYVIVLFLLPQPSECHWVHTPEIEYRECRILPVFSINGVAFIQ